MEREWWCLREAAWAAWRGEDGVAVRRHRGEGGVAMRRHEAEVVVSPVGDRYVKWAGFLWAARVQILMG